LRPLVCFAKCRYTAVLSYLIYARRGQKDKLRKKGLLAFETNRARVGIDAWYGDKAEESTDKHLESEGVGVWRAPLVRDRSCGDSESLRFYDLRLGGDHEIVDGICVPAVVGWFGDCAGG